MWFNRDGLTSQVIHLCQLGLQPSLEPSLCWKSRHVSPHRRCGAVPCQRASRKPMSHTTQISPTSASQSSSKMAHMITALLWRARLVVGASREMANLIRRLLLQENPIKASLANTRITTLHPTPARKRRFLCPCSRLTLSHRPTSIAALPLPILHLPPTSQPSSLHQTRTPTAQLPPPCSIHYLQLNQSAFTIGGSRMSTMVSTHTMTSQYS